MSKTKENYKLATVIMAAGKGTRMKDPGKAKVMYEVLGKPMIHYVIETANEISSDRIIVIVGYQREAVISYIQQSHHGTEIVIQVEQLGTGHAIMQTRDSLNGFGGDVLILSGDVPLLTAKSLRRLIDHHRTTISDATILTAEFQDPSGYGRIIRNADGLVKKIVEHKDATENQKQITEINSGIYVVDCEKLFESLKSIKPNNVQKEYYLTDIFEYFWKHQWKVSALQSSDSHEILGINTVKQLEDVQRTLLARG